MVINLKVNMGKVQMTLNETYLHHFEPKWHQKNTCRCPNFLSSGPLNLTGENH